MNKENIAIVIALIALVICGLSALYVVRSAVLEIEEKGLKNIVSEIWNGHQGNSGNSGD